MFKPILFSKEVVVSRNTAIDSRLRGDLNFEIDIVAKALSNDLEFLRGIAKHAVLTKYEDHYNDELKIGVTIYVVNGDEVQNEHTRTINMTAAYNQSSSTKLSPNEQLVARIMKGRW